MLRYPDCAHCGKQFFARRLGTKYCSSKCRESFWHEKKRKKAKTETKPKSCPGCGIEIHSTDKRKKFCSRECRWKYFNAKRPTTKDKPRECIGCGDVFRPKQTRGVGRRYCSEQCRRKTRYQRFKAKRTNRTFIWKQKNKWGGSWYAALKRDRFTCRVCGKKSYPSQWQSNSSSLLVHHLDGSGEREAKNHALENLMTVCKPCHHLFHQKIHLVFVDGKWMVSGQIFKLLGINRLETTE